MKSIRKSLDFIIYSNLFIALVALAFTFEAQILLGQPLSWHPYLFIIFFATFFDYNLHRLYTLIRYPSAIALEKHQWVRKHKLTFYILMCISTIGFIIAIWNAKPEVLIVLSPLALLTVFYSIPFYKSNNKTLRLRDIPFLKLFLIAFNWTIITLLLPLVQAGQSINITDFLALSLERFLFMCAICLPFDIRDMESDAASGLSTIPIKIGEKAAWQLTGGLMITSIAVSLLYHGVKGDYFIAAAFVLSGLLNLVLIQSKQLRQHPNFHHGIVDGTMLIQAMSIVLAEWLKTVIL